MSKSREQLEMELDMNIPREAVSSRSGGGTKQLSYLETWYVINRLNKVFGNLGWDSETVEMIPVNGPNEKPAYRAKVKITVSAPVYSQDGTLEGFRNVVKEGNGWGSDKSTQNPHEMAVKEAESDALKRAAMKLGISMGLGLYDKSGDFVEDDATAKSTKTINPTPTTVPDNRDALNKKITAIARVCIAKGKYTKESFQVMRRNTFGVDTTEALTDEHAKLLFAQLEGESK